MTLLKKKKISDEDAAYVVQMLSSVHSIGDAFIQTIRQYGIAFSLEKGEHLFVEGETCYYVYLIRKGAVMGYSSVKNKTITTYISVENEFVSSLSGWFASSPSREAAVAVEDSYILGIHINILRELFETDFDLNYIFRTVIERYYLDAQERAYIIRVGNARERFAYFHKTKAGYIERLPVEAIASLLDMKPDTLLRIRKQYLEEEQRHADVENLKNQLESYIQDNGYYKNKSVSLQDLADELNTSSHKLSWLLNSSYGVNFKNFINSYRVSYVAEMLRTSSDWQTYTIEALAYESGFSSRSTFYTCFKKQIGKSPMEYVQNYFSL